MTRCQADLLLSQCNCDTDGEYNFLAYQKISGFNIYKPINLDGPLIFLHYDNLVKITEGTSF